MRESGEAKGFLDVTLGATPDIHFVPTTTRPYADLPVVDASGLAAGTVFEACEAALATVPAGAVARLRITGLAADLRGSLDWRRLRQAGSRLLDLNIDAEFADDSHRADSGVTLGALAQEFEAYAATYPLEGVDRATLLTHARDILRDAREGA
jgi:hypothetical protein